MIVNNAKNKRQAHTLSRGGDQSWNPFQHVHWDKREKRAETWGGAGGRLEAQQPTEGNGDDLAHSRTEPAPSTMPRDTSNVDTMVGSAGSTSKEGLEDALRRKEEAASGDGGLRNRKQEEDALKVNTNLDSPSKPTEYTDDDNNGKKKKPEKEGWLRHVEPKTPFTFANQLQRTLLNSWINLLLIAAPIGIALNYVHGISGVVVFCVNFIAIIPLAAMLSFATEEIALRTGETLGGLLNATFGNAVELIVAIIALIDGKIRIVQTSLVGSVLSNLLLVLGFCFFFGGLRRQEQHFNHVVAQTAASMLALAIASIIIPTVFNAQENTPVDKVAKLSRGTSVILLLVYIAYLFFQLKTHHAVFSEESQKVPAKPFRSGPTAGAIKQGLAVPGAVLGHGVQETSENDRISKMLMSPLPPNDDDEEEPQLHFFVALGTLAASTVVIALCAEYMVSGIDAVTKGSSGISEEFVGLILLPIVGNAAEHATAVTVAIKDKMDLAIGVAVGSSMQVALFLIPLVVVIGWGMGLEEMNLSFDIFQVAVLFVAVLLVNYLIGDGKSHWLEGFLLICLYFIIAVCAFCKLSHSPPVLLLPFALLSSILPTTHAVSTIHNDASANLESTVYPNTETEE